MIKPGQHPAMMKAMVDAMIGDWFSVDLVQHKSQREIMTAALAAALRVAAEWEVPHKLVGIEAEPTMVEAGAKRLAGFEDDSIWPDSWEHFQVSAMYNQADRLWRAMFDAAGKIP